MLPLFLLVRYHNLPINNLLKFSENSNKNSSFFSSVWKTIETQNVEVVAMTTTLDTVTIAIRKAKDVENLIKGLNFSGSTKGFT